jgi:hypothetical protein
VTSVESRPSRSRRASNWPARRPSDHGTISGRPTRHWRSDRWTRRPRPPRSPSRTRPRAPRSRTRIGHQS